MKRMLIAAGLVLMTIYECGGGDGGSGRLPASTAVASTAHETLACLTPQTLSAVRAEPASGTRAAFNACRPEFSAKTATLQLTDAQTRVAFASVLANAMAPYGESRSISLGDLLAERHLDCDNYAILAGYLAGFLVGESGFSFVGFDGGAIGNHAQLFVREGQLLLDPTIGLVARAGFDQVLMGKPVDERQIRIFRQHFDGTTDAFASRIRVALTTGSYRPSDLLYFFPSLNEYLKFSDEIAPLWADDADALLRRFPTPGARALRHSLAKSQ